MRNILRGSTAVSLVRQSQTARLYARLREVVSRRLESPDSADSTEPEAAASARAAETTREGGTAGDSSSLVAGSVLFAFVGLLGTWIEASWLYRWLTAEPDPDVIVIDLRETWTVGPVLAVIDWFVTRLATIGEHASSVRLAGQGSRLLADRPVQVASALLGGLALVLGGRIALSPTTSAQLVVFTALLAICALVGSRNSQSWAELRQTRLVRLLVAAFEPPEPPDRQSKSEDANSESADDEP
ncbi:hypothetical protein [Halovenus sp. HT40]|uniref:hypothetical protein n=1 Tax=Halovenus sp. HT40 TaxID=3126691 RepID=UPI00300F5A8D